MATALQLVGLGLVAVGAFLLAPWAGVVVAGAALTWIGLSLEGDDA